MDAAASAVRRRAILRSEAREVLGSETARSGLAKKFCRIYCRTAGSGLDRRTKFPFEFRYVPGGSVDHLRAAATELIPLRPVKHWRREPLLDMGARRRRSCWFRSRNDLAGESLSAQSLM